MHWLLESMRFLEKLKLWAKIYKLAKQIETNPQFTLQLDDEPGSAMTVYEPHALPARRQETGSAGCRGALLFQAEEEELVATGKEKQNGTKSSCAGMPGDSPCTSCLQANKVWKAKVQAPGVPASRWVLAALPSQPPCITAPSSFSRTPLWGQVFV